MEAPRVRVLKVEGMDCADCARKVASALEEVPGVVGVQVNYASGKAYLVLEREEALREAEARLAPLGYRLLQAEGEGEGLPGPWPWALLSGGLLLLAWVWDAFFAGGGLPYALAALVGVLPLARKGLLGFRRNPFGIQVLVSLATFGALAIGAAQEAAVVVFLFLLGEVLEAQATLQARKGLLSLGGLLPRRALRVGEVGVEEVPLSALRVGDLVRVPQGERVPADGVVASGEAWVEEAAFTGEPLPKAKGKGDRVFGGSLVEGGALLVRVERLPGEGFLAEMARLAEEAMLKKAELERFMDAFSRRYTPFVLLLAGFVAFVLPVFLGDFPGHLYKALALLLIACPCALVVSVPAAIASGVARGARLGVLFKSGAALERLSQVRHLALDKTGTLTLGRPRLVRVVPFGVRAEEALALAKGVAQGSAHPLARAVREAEGPLAQAGDHREVPGQGVFARVGGKEVGLLRPEALPLPPEVREAVASLAAEGHTLSLLVEGARPLALLAFRDEPREEARAALQALRRMGLRLHLLTGDRKEAALALARALGLEAGEVEAGLSPEDKLRRVAALAEAGGVAMVGDGVNDAPALARATVGLAVVEGTEAALRAADVGLLSLEALPRAFVLSRKTLAVVWQNVLFALGLKGLFLLTTLLGLTGLWPAVLADSGALVLVTLNSLRLLRAPLP
ncbi:heavy metal translocating P-type ATPase [Thermus thermophilus]|uniref:heavy metal translocating P-type ATPase n=1 Tax=Thermus thermophilus TaxID=274 RepID=UPI001FCA4E8C|nr:cation-translocating P-type ATPase [Thermus thermophilus]